MTQWGTSQANVECTASVVNVYEDGAVMYRVFINDQQNGVILDKEILILKGEILQDFKPGEMQELQV